MQSRRDPRHLIRIKVVKELFSRSFNPKTKFENELSSKVTEDLAHTDQEISLAAPSRPLEQINPIDLAILRLAVYELFEKKIPLKVVVDEAIEIGKEFGSDSTPSFINGVLGKVIKNHHLETAS